MPINTEKTKEMKVYIPVKMYESLQKLHTAFNLELEKKISFSKFITGLLFNEIADIYGKIKECEEHDEHSDNHGEIN